MTVHDLGEKAFIRQVLSGYATTARAEALDDCVVIDPERLFGLTNAPLIVYSIDHPSRIDRPIPAGFEWRFYGRWLAACTCNDVLAMGARPRGFALDLAVPAGTHLDDVDQLCTGICDVLAVYGVEFEGGNTDINQCIETVAMSWGTVPRTGLIRRRGARPGDYIAVTTELGIGWASYLLRQRGRYGNLAEPDRGVLDRYNLMPLAPHRAIIDASELLPGAITSGMDLSDGLVEFLYGIAGQPGNGVRIEEWRLPSSRLLESCADQLGVPTSALAIEYGYDMPRAHGYTVAPERWDALVDLFESNGWPLFRVGTVTEQPGVAWIPNTGAARQLPPLWDDKARRTEAVSQWTTVAQRLFD